MYPSYILNYSKLLTIKREKLEMWLKFLKLHHPQYNDVIIDQNSLSSYSDDDVMSQFVNKVTIVSDITSIDINSEEGIDVEYNKHTTPVNCWNQLQNSVLVDENGATVSGKDLLDYLKTSLEPSIIHESNTCLFTAMIPGSKLLATNTATFYSMAFFDLYPCGLGMPRQSNRPTSLDFESDISFKLSHSRSSSHRTNLLFMYVSYDIIQKQQVFAGIHYRIKTMRPELLKKINTLKADDLSEFIDDIRNHAPNSPTTLDGTKYLTINDITHQLFLMGSAAPFSQFSKRKNKLELKSMIVQMGSPLFYLTLTPNDTRHFLSYLFCLKDPSTFNFESNDMTDEKFRGIQNSSSPVSLAEFFNTIVATIITCMFGDGNKNKDGIFGKLRAYYGMVETQGRGTLHIHILLWIGGSSSPLVLYEKLCNDAEFKKALLVYLESVVHNDNLHKQLPLPECLDPFYVNSQVTTVDTSLSLKLSSTNSCDALSPSIDCGVHSSNTQCTSTKYGTNTINNNLCNLCQESKLQHQYDVFLNPSSSTFVNDLHHHINNAVHTYQLHRHSASCFKNKSCKGCRYRKPDLESPISFFDTTTGVLHMHKNNGMVNNFNLFLTLLTKSNTDVQFISSGLSAISILHYICSYIVKQSLSIDSYYTIIKAALKTREASPLQTSGPEFTPAQNSARDFYLRFYMALKTCTQVSANEVATKLLQLPMCYSSHKFKLLYGYNYFDAYNIIANIDINKLGEDRLNSTSLSDALSTLPIALTKNGKLKSNHILDYIYRYVDVFLLL